VLRRNLSCMATIIKRLFTFQDQQIVLGAGDLRLPSSATTVLDGSVAPGERGATIGFLILQSIVLRGAAPYVIWIESRLGWERSKPVVSRAAGPAFCC
jgi:hypothetical protein